MEYWQAGSGWYKLALGGRGQLVPGNAVLPLVPGSADYMRWLYSGIQCPDPLDRGPTKYHGLWSGLLFES